METDEPVSAIEVLYDWLLIKALAQGWTAHPVDGATPGEKILGLTTSDGIGLSVTINYTP